MSVAFPGESAEYRAARDLLLAQEIELRRATEAVAAGRRTLPPGGVAPFSMALPAKSRVQVAENAARVRTSSVVGSFEASCEDALGATIVSTWSIIADDEAGLSLGGRTVSYRLSERGSVLPHVPLLKQWRGSGVGDS